MFDHGFPSDWSTLKKLIWLKGAGIAGASYIWKTVTGTLIHITDALSSPMQKCEVTLEPIQDLHGQDAPWPAGGGKNKLDVELPIVLGSPSIIGNKTCVLPAGTYTFTSKTSVSAAYNLAVYNSSDTKIAEVASSTSSSSDLSVTFTISEQSAYIRVYYNAACSITNMQIEEGSSFTGYKPYSNICPITGWTGCEVTRTGKNLLDVDSIAPLQSNVGITRSGWKIAKAGTYIVSAQNKGNWTIGARKIVDDTYGTVSYISTSSSTNIATYTIADGEQLIVWDVDTSTLAQSKTIFTNAQIQVELGSTATDYEPYNGNQISVNWEDEAGTVYGGTDEVVGGELIKASSDKIDLSTLGGYGTNLYGFDDVYRNFTGFDYQSILACEMFAIREIATQVRDFGGVCLVETTNGTRLLFRVLGKTSAETKALIESTPNNIVLNLTQPQTYQLTPQQISTLKGENNVWGSGDIELTYKAQA